MSINCTIQNLDNYYCITVNPVEEQNIQRLPVKIILVLDVSGSMNSNVSNNIENTNITILDLVKHTCKTIIMSLNENDELSIITYSTIAVVKVPLNCMNEDNKKDTLKLIDEIIADGMTNIYDGVKKALEIANNTINTTILLLSDGVPNIEPPRGTIIQFEKDIQEMQNKCPIINTFGFGYAVQSDVLTSISTRACGTYSFIPDANFVGTVIINSLANTLCSFYKNASLTIDLKDKKYELLGITN